jgi:hypothetical protein
MEASDPPKEFESWGIDDVGNWLEKIVSLPQYKPVFAELAIDGSLLQHIIDEDLISDFQIKIRLHRIKIVEAIKKLNIEYTRKIDEDFSSRVNIDDEEPEECKNISGKSHLNPLFTLRLYVKHICEFNSLNYLTTTTFYLSLPLLVHTYTFLSNLISNFHLSYLPK